MSLLESYSLDVCDPADIIAVSEPGYRLEQWLGQRPEWMTRGACRGEPTETFFPSTWQATRPAVAICETCPVLPACLRYALDDPTLQGIWGGTTPQERATIRRAAKTGV